MQSTLDQASQMGSSPRIKQRSHFKKLCFERDYSNQQIKLGYRNNNNIALNREKVTG